MLSLCDSDFVHRAAAGDVCTDVVELFFCLDSGDEDHGVLVVEGHLVDFISLGI